MGASSHPTNPGSKIIDNVFPIKTFHSCFLKYLFAGSPILSSCALLGHWQVESRQWVNVTYAIYACVFQF